MKVLIIKFVNYYNFEINEEDKLKIIRGLTNHPIDDRLIKIKAKKL